MSMHEQQMKANDSYASLFRATMPQSSHSDRRDLLLEAYALTDMLGFGSRCGGFVRNAGGNLRTTWVPALR
jgi:hypothetical protein